jgi:hypothetical protein
MMMSVQQAAVWFLGRFLLDVTASISRYGSQRTTIFGFCFMVSIRKDVAVGVKLEEGTEAGIWCWISSAV